MPIISLTTEWNTNDYYLGAVKGTIRTKSPGVEIVDISHQISKFNIAQAAFTIRNSYHYFPEGTVHVVAVKSEATEENPYIAFRQNGHYFVGTDNGIFGLIFDERPEYITSIETGEKRVDESIVESTFPELTVLTNAACFLANGGKIENLGIERERLFRQVQMLPTIEENTIVGSVIYIDSYRNAITNITRKLFTQVGGDRPFDIFVQNNYYKISKINSHYHETTDGEILAVFNSLDLLEIAINKGNAADLLNLDTKSNIRIKFHDYQDR